MKMERDVGQKDGVSSRSIKGCVSKPKNCDQNAKAQTVVKMSGNSGQISEQQVKNLDEVKSSSEPQKKPQVVQIINQRLVVHISVKYLNFKLFPIFGGPQVFLNSNESILSLGRGSGSRKS